MSGDGWKQMPGQPRICAGCGKRLRLRADSLWLDTSRRLSWHFYCRPRKATLR
jgi:hypothetical protein